MEKKENIIRMWFNMWIDKKDYGIKEIFSEKIEYIESWGPKYYGTGEILEWFFQWNKLNSCISWDIKQFFHKENQTIVEWYFKFSHINGETMDFDGVSLISWDREGKIQFLKEFKCDL